jgi:phage protein D
MSDVGTLADSSSIHGDGVVRIGIEVGGEMLTALPIVSLTVRRAINWLPWAEIVLADGDISTGTFDWSDKPTFSPGAEVTISAGYGEELAVLFRGAVVRHGVKIDEQSCSRLVIECRDKAAQMTFGRNFANYVHQEDGDTISTLIGSYGLSADVAPIGAGHHEPARRHCSDWDFILAHAEANGLVVQVDAGAVTVKAPNTSGSAVLACTWGLDLISFEACVDVARQIGALAPIQGRMRFRGSARAVPDSLIEVKGVGARFSGKVYVAAVEHAFVNGEWVTHAELGQHPQHHVEREGVAAKRGDGSIADTNALQIEGGVITVITPGNNRVVLDDNNQTVVMQDQRNNSVKLSKEGIALNSQSDITLSAKGGININALTDAKITGLNITCEAGVGFAGKGLATAELSAAGQTTVKGGMVMIN